MRYEVLGEFRVISDGREFTLKSPKMKILLAALLVRSNNVVSAGRLLMELWGENLPRRADAGLYVYISQLRKFLVGIGEPEGAIITRSPGYMLHPGPAELDFELFQDTMRRGREQFKAGSAAEAICTLESALLLHRGSVLSGLQGGPIITSFAVWVEESRLECLEMLVEAYLLLDRPREVVGMLYSLIAEHPLREAFYRLLMIALYRSGRQADALRLYRQAREIIVREIGLEPCRSLRELQQAILLDDRTIDARVAV